MDLLSTECASRSIGPANQMLSTFITTIVALHCNMSSIEKWPTGYGTRPITQSLPDHDYVVIGSGSAGSVVAGRLAENGRNKVLLIEAGGNPPTDSEIPGLARSMLSTDIDWSYPMEPNQLSCLGLKNQSCILNAGKVLGGSHTINGMIYLRGNSYDYDAWEKMGNPGWGWENILAYFKKTERFHGRDNSGVHGKQGLLNIERFHIPRDDPSLISRATRELGYRYIDDFSAGKYLGFGKFYGTLRRGRRMTTARAFLTEEKTNLLVVKKGVAKKIIFDDKLRAKRVHFVYRDDLEMEVQAKKEIIISAGSIETPKLLMLSGIGPESHLTSLGIPLLKNLDVGENLQDHIRVFLFMKLDEYEELGSDFEFLDTFYNQWVHGKGSLGSTCLDITGFIDTDSNGKYPDIQYLFADVPKIAEFTTQFEDSIVKSLESQIESSQRIIAVSVILLKPTSRGTVRLRSNDYRDKPIITPNYLESQDDVKIMIRGVRKILNLENAPSVVEMNGVFMKPDLPACDKFEYRSEVYWECYIRHMSSSLYHPVGTVKMGHKNDTSSVVNAELKVRGVKGLRVIDASVMPTLVSANINSAVIMVGEKGVDSITKN